jgi:Putative transposase DNA-binding domain
MNGRSFFPLLPYNVIVSYNPIEHIPARKTLPIMKRAKTTTFLLELPLRVDVGQAHRLHAHFEVARCFYNNLLGEANRRLKRMRSDPFWRQAQQIPRTHKQERAQAYAQLRKRYGFSEFAMHDYAKAHRVGWLVWGKDHLAALIEWNDPVVKHGLGQRIKFARLIRRKASSPQAEGADLQGYRYYVQLALEGVPYQKPKNFAGPATIGLDIGPSSLAIFPQQGAAQLVTFCEEIKPNAREKCRLQRQMDRQRRANNPDNYDEQGQCKKGHRNWKDSKRSQKIRRRHAALERRIAAHRKSLHGKLVNDIVRVGNTIQIEKTSFRAWQKLYGRSVGLRAPGMFVAHLKRTVAKTGGILTEVGTYKTKLSQYCHQCGQYKKKPLAQRWHLCPCGLGPVQRDLYSAFLLAYMKPTDITPSIDHLVWKGSESSLRAAVEVLLQRANDRQVLPRSFGIPGGRARQLESPECCQQELAPTLVYWREKREALVNGKEPPA